MQTTLIKQIHVIIKNDLKRNRPAKRRRKARANYEHRNRKKIAVVINFVKAIELLDRYIISKIKSGATFENGGVYVNSENGEYIIPNNFRPNRLINKSDKTT